MKMIKSVVACASAALTVAMSLSAWAQSSGQISPAEKTAADIASTGKKPGSGSNMTSGSDKNSGKVAGSDKAMADKPVNAGSRPVSSKPAAHQGEGDASNMTSGSDKNSGRVAGSGASAPANLKGKNTP